MQGVQPSLDSKAASNFVAEHPEKLAEVDVPELAIGGSMRTVPSVSRSEINCLYLIPASLKVPVDPKISSNFQPIALF